MSLFRIIFLLFLTAAAGAADQVWLSGSASGAAAAHYRRQINQLFPSERKTRIRFEFKVPQSGTGRLTFHRIRPNQYEIILPSSSTEWLADPEKRMLLVKWLTCARLGFPLERAVLFPDSWLFAALAMPVDGFFFSRQTRFPGAYALISHGIHFPVERIVRYPLPSSQSAAYQLYAEWSRILFEVCQREGVIQHGAGEAFFRRLSARPESDQYRLFLELFMPSITAKLPALKPDIWFSAESEKWMLTAFSPADCEYAESRVHTILKTGTKEDIALLFERKEPLKTEDKLRISKAVVEMMRLSMFTTQKLSHPIRQMLPAMEFLKNIGYSESNRKHFRSALQQLFRAIALESAQNEMLRQAENRLVLPGARHFMMHAVSPAAEEPAMLKAANAMLDHFERRTP